MNVGYLYSHYHVSIGFIEVDTTPRRLVPE